MSRDTAENRAAYVRGWAASVRHAEGALERADDRGEIGAWYDGYLDYAADRPKWHTLRCLSDNHDTCDTP